MTSSMFQSKILNFPFPKQMKRALRKLNLICKIIEYTKFTRISISTYINVAIHSDISTKLFEYIYPMAYKTTYLALLTPRNVWALADKNWLYKSWERIPSWINLCRNKQVDHQNYIRHIWKYYNKIGLLTRSIASIILSFFSGEASFSLTEGSLCAPSTSRIGSFCVFPEVTLKMFCTQRLQTWIFEKNQNNKLQ